MHNKAAYPPKESLYISDELIKAYDTFKMREGQLSTMLSTLNSGDLLLQRTIPVAEQDDDLLHKEVIGVRFVRDVVVPELPKIAADGQLVPTPYLLDVVKKPDGLPKK